MTEGIRIISALLLLGSALACRPIIRLYESEGYGNDYVEDARSYIGFDDEPNITSHGMTNDRIHYCPEGVWMGYNEENYGGNSYILASGKNTADGLTSCSYENTGRKFRSLRVLGSKADSSASALVTYPEIYNRGLPTNYFNDTSSMSVPFESFVITGNEEVELFTSSGFRGLSVCIGPNNAYINDWWQYEDVNHLRNGTSRFTYFGSISSILGALQFQSFRFGCADQNKL